MIRIRIDLAYRGTGYAGWAIQPGQATVQGALEGALARVLRLERVRATVAGRTDAGVHARGQVIHVDLPQEVWDRVPGRSQREPGEALVGRLNAVLPDDVVVHRAEVAPPGFDARFSALRRRYTYRIADRLRLRDPLTSDFTFWSKSELDVEAMQTSMQPLLGLHDFAAFCRPREGASTIRELQAVGWERVASGPEAGLILGRVQADAFCHNLVRALVGASIAVGSGRQSVDWPEQLLIGRKRDPGVVIVPPHGLVLDEVVFPRDADLRTRAERVRAKRMDEEVLGG